MFKSIGEGFEGFSVVLCFVEWFKRLLFLYGMSIVIFFLYFCLWFFLEKVLVIYMLKIDNDLCGI